MDPVDAIGMALTPGTVFNQQNKVFRSAKALAQFANVGQGDVLALVAENLADRVTIRPSAKRPENGPLIALTEFIPDQAEPALVKIMGGNVFEGLAEGAEEVAQPTLVENAEALMEAVQQVTGEMDEEDDQDEPDHTHDGIGNGMEDEEDEEVA
jgi:hypothetical protein